MSLLLLSADVDPDEEFRLMLKWHEPAAHPRPMLEGMDVETLSTLLDSGNLQWYEPRPEPDRWEVVVGMKIHAPPEAVWKVATDYELYCKIMPDSFAECKTEYRKGVEVKNVYTMQTSVFMYTFTMEVIDLVTEAPPYSLRVKTIEGGVKGREIEVTKDTDPSMAIHVSVEEALEHMDRCIGSGLIPQIGRVDADPFMPGMKPRNWDHFLTLCFCCPCCCVAMREWQKWSPKVKDRMHGLEGLTIEVTDECNGCGICVKKCFTEAIAVKDKLASINTDDCKGCGICAEVCPRDAIEIKVSDGDKLLKEAFKRIDSYADIVSETVNSGESSQ